jgi:hypothetical protein
MDYKRLCTNIAYRKNVTRITLYKINIELKYQVYLFDEDFL